MSECTKRTGDGDAKDGLAMVPLKNLREFGDRLAAARSSQQAVELTAHFVLKTEHAYSVAIFLVNPNGNLDLRFGLDQQGRVIPNVVSPGMQEIAFQVCQSAQPLIASDPAPGEQDQVSSSLGRHGVKAYVGLPLRSGRDALGALFVGYSRPRTFSQVEVESLLFYASYAAGTIDRLHLLEESQRRQTDLSIMVELAHMIISTLDLEEMLQHVAIRLASLVGMDDCAISSFEPDPDRVRLVAEYSNLGVRDDTDRGKAYYLVDYPLTAKVLKSGEPVVVRSGDAGVYPAEVALLRELHFETLLMLPLKAGSKPVGLVELYSRKLDFRISDSDLQRLHGLSEQVALAMANARLYEKEQHIRLAAETLRQAAAALSATLDLNQVLDLILEQLQRVVSFDSASLMLLNDGQLNVFAVHGHPHPEAALQVKIRVQDDDLAREVIERKRLVILPDAQIETRFRRLGEADHVRGWMGVPMVALGQMVGLLTVDSRTPDAYTPEDADLATAFANQAGLAIVNARLFQSEREQRTLAEALREISLALSSSLDTGALLETLLDQVRRVVPYDTASVMLLLEEEKVRIAAHRGFDRFDVAHHIKGFRLKVENTPNLARMAFTRQPHYVSDVKVNNKDWIDLEITRHVGSWLGAPLVAQNRLLGFLSLDKVERGYYIAIHAERIEALASHAALALYNALSYGEVEQASITDFITGTYNHRYLHQQLRRELERAWRLGYPVSLLMIDIDDFKVVNDMHGHQFGDQVLRLLAGRIKGELRIVDMLARYGGEEFAIILPGLSAQSLPDVGERLRRAVAVPPFEVEGSSIFITVSVGGATFPDHAQDVRTLVTYADQAMYQAKDKGRNLVYVESLGKERG